MSSGREVEDVGLNEFARLDNPLLRQYTAAGLLRILWETVC